MIPLTKYNNHKWILNGSITITVAITYLGRVMWANSNKYSTHYTVQKFGVLKLD